VVDKDDPTPFSVTEWLAHAAASLPGDYNTPASNMPLLTNFLNEKCRTLWYNCSVDQSKVFTGII